MKAFRFTKAPIDQSKVAKAVALIVAEISNLDHILAIYLFGSASENKANDQSDIDLLVVASDIQSIKSAQKKLRHIQTLTDFPVDLVWVDLAQFNRKKDLGGVCMIAYHDGRCVYSRDQRVKND